MASMTMTASFLGGSAAAAAAKQNPVSTRRGGLMVVRASRESDNMVEANTKGESSRRGLMFAVAAAAACSVAKIAMAEEPKRGSPDAKKKYGPVCVTNPTARICRY